MTAISATTGPEQTAGFANRDPIAWITTVVRTLVHETRLASSADIEDLVIISYVGLLDCPDPDVLTQEHLLERCRQQLVVWAWEQGKADEPVPTARAAAGPGHGRPVET